MAILLFLHAARSTHPRQQIGRQRHKAFCRKAAGHVTDVLVQASVLVNHKYAGVPARTSGLHQVAVHLNLSGGKTNGVG